MKNNNIFSGIIIGIVISSIMFMGFYYAIQGNNSRDAIIESNPFLNNIDKVPGCGTSGEFSC